MGSGSSTSNGMYAKAFAKAFAEAKAVENSFDGLSYLLYGKHTTPNSTILFLHGNTASKESFVHLVPKLMAKYNCVILVDLPGFGKSDSIEGKFGLKNANDHLHRLLSHLEIPSCIFAGWSLGGHISIRQKFHYPDDVSGLVVFGTPPINASTKEELGVEFGKAFDGSAYPDYNEEHHLKLVSLLSKEGLLDQEEADMFMKHPVNDEDFIASPIYEYQVQIAMTSTAAGRARKEYIGCFFEEMCNERDVFLGVENARLIHAEQDGVISLSYLEQVDKDHQEKYGKNILHVLKGARHASFMGATTDEFVEILLSMS